MIQPIKRIMPQEKLKKKEKEEQTKEEQPEKEVDVAEIEVEDNEISKEIKKRTDKAQKDYLKTDHPIPITYIGFDKDMNALVEGVLNDKEVRKRDKQRKKQDREKEGKRSLFRRRKDG